MINLKELEEKLNLTENSELEFKLAKGGLPNSIWETYSAFTNTNGGYIILGVEETTSGYVSKGVPNISKIQIDFWNIINNPNKVSINLLNNHDVYIVDTDKEPILVINIPRGGRRERPIYINSIPLVGTFRRNWEGDYRCTPDEVRRMLSDQSEISRDSLILEGFTLDDLEILYLSTISKPPFLNI
jgi:predicted HTH transcriptional regulator